MVSEVGPNKNRAEQRPVGEGEEAGGVDAERQKVGTGLLTLVDFLVLKSIDPHFSAAACKGRRPLVFRTGFPPVRGFPSQMVWLAQN